MTKNQTAVLPYTDFDALSIGGSKAPDKTVNGELFRRRLLRSIKVAGIDTTCEAASVYYGIVTLRLHIDAGKLVRYNVDKEQSFLAGVSKAPIRT
jgi:hypothetical protein